MSVYLIARFSIHDRAVYDRYEAGFGEVWERHAVPVGGKILSVDEAPKVLQGDFTETRSVLMEFPDPASAYAWMGSEDYRAIAAHRLAGSDGTVVMVRSFDGVPEDRSQGDIS